MKLKQMGNFKNKIIGFLGLLISVIFIIFFNDIIICLTDFSEKYISSDHYIEPEIINWLKNLVFVFILLIISLSILSFLNIFNKVLPFLNNFIDFENAEKFFFTDDICGKKQLSIYLFLIATTLGFLLHLAFLIFGQPSHEGIVENSSSLLFLFSGLILIFSCTRIDKRLFSFGTRKRIIYTLIVISGIFLFIFGEEISWGQRIFNWESFGIFKEYNFQSETNAHNFISPLFKFIYPTVGVSSFVVLFLIWVFPKKRKTYLFNLFIPHPSLFFLVLIMAGSSFSGHSEIYEVLLAIFALLYSLRILICLSSSKKELSYREES